MMTAAAKKLMYHNHSWEYESKCADGRSIMEFLSDEIPASLMGFTLDFCWLKYRIPVMVRIRLTA